MEKENKPTYDSAMARVEEIVQQLEQSEAISLEAYDVLAKEAKELLAFCRAEIENLEEQLTKDAQ